MKGELMKFYMKVKLYKTAWKPLKALQTSLKYLKIQSSNEKEKCKKCFETIDKQRFKWNPPAF